MQIKTRAFLVSVALRCRPGPRGFFSAKPRKPRGTMCGLGPASWVKVSAVLDFWHGYKSAAELPPGSMRVKEEEVLL